MVNRRELSRCLAWMVYLESILLNDQFNQDMKTYVPECANQWHIFFGPEPCFEAVDAFTQYTMARWPLKIFTVDPVNTEQNIADVSIVYREMQLAVALSVASGNMGVGAAVSALRQIQRETATIDLNRIAVGFTHGEDTFGWRFYPRFQTPPVESNLTAFFRDTLIGGPTDKHLEMKKEIEPGMRECVALIIMPSFLKGVTIDTRSNWFKLHKPGHTAMSMQDTMKFSRAVEQMRRNVEQCVCNQHLYRPGEVSRVLTRVRQLDRELPLQTLSCQVPVENALGGFELLASGTRELAPELLGWYGAPGYDPEKGGTFFLVGNNFSVHDTRVIAGGQEISTNNPLANTDCENCSNAIAAAIDGATCPAGDDGTPASEKAKERCNASELLLNRPSVTLLSRDVMQVVLPRRLPAVRDFRLNNLPKGTLIDDPKETPQYRGYVDVHAATPYGVSGHLLIPVICPQEICTTCEDRISASVAGVTKELNKCQEELGKCEKKPTVAAKPKVATATIGACSNLSVFAESQPGTPAGALATLKKLWFIKATGFPRIDVTPKKNTPLPDEVDVRIVITDDSGLASIGSIVLRQQKVLHTKPASNGEIHIDVNEQLKLLENSGSLFQLVSASQKVLNNVNENLILTLNF